MKDEKRKMAWGGITKSLKTGDEAEDPDRNS